MFIVLRNLLPRLGIFTVTPPIYLPTNVFFFSAFHIFKNNSHKILYYNILSSIWLNHIYFPKYDLFPHINYIQINFYWINFQSNLICLCTKIIVDLLTLTHFPWEVVLINLHLTLVLISINNNMLILKGLLRSKQG